MFTGKNQCCAVYELKKISLKLKKILMNSHRLIKGKPV